MFRTRERTFKATVKVEDSRRKREELSNMLRKSAREDAMEKRRQRVDTEEGMFLCIHLPSPLLSIIFDPIIFLYSQDNIINLMVI